MIPHHVRPYWTRQRCLIAGVIIGATTANLIDLTIMILFPL
jgi:hypothetical protein